MGLLVSRMARFKPYDYRQHQMVVVNFEDQLAAGSLEHAIHYLIEERVEDEWFEELYGNDDTGRPAYSPKLLLKVTLLAYARGMGTSRRIETACRENVTFMALSCGMKPDHSTVAAFHQRLEGRLDVIFAEILLVCQEEGLLSGTHFSLDGLKLPANASRELSGTFKDLRLKQDKLKRKLAEMSAEHRRQDRLDAKRQAPSAAAEKVKRAESIRRLQQKAEKIGAFLESNEPKIGLLGKEIQSNVTDNDSCRMQTSHGCIQGYNAQALVDDKHQVIVAGLASGTGQDSRQIEPVFAALEETLGLAGMGAIEGITLTADANYHSEFNLNTCEEKNLDAYIPDVLFRMRDERFAGRERHKEKVKKGRFTLADFVYDTASDTFGCPGEETLTLEAVRVLNPAGKPYRRYCSEREACAGCPLREQCLGPKGSFRSLHVPLDYTPQQTLCQQMREKIDLPESKVIYGKRVGIVEPVFANIRSNKKMDRIYYRGAAKTNIQWLLYCLVHNIEKIAGYGKTYNQPGGPRGCRRRLRAHKRSSVAGSRPYRRFRSLLAFPNSFLTNSMGNSRFYGFDLPAHPNWAFPTPTLSA